MSYFEDDDASQVRDLKDRIDNLQAQLLGLPSSIQLENVETGQSIFPGANPSARGGGTGGGGFTEPLLHTITTITPVTLPSKTNIDSSLTNVFKITLDRDIEFDIINPSGTKFEMLHIVITQDVTTARTVTWPGSVNGTPSIDSTLGSETTISLYNMADGTWRFVSTEGGIVGGGSGNLSDLTIDTDKDWLQKNINNVNILDLTGTDSKIKDAKKIEFDQTGQLIESIAGQLKYSVAALQMHSFFANTVEIARFTESASSVFRLDMLDHSIVNAQDLRLDDTSGAVVFAGTDPAIGYDFAAARFIINYPTGASIFVTENNTIGTTVIKTDSLEANIVTANDLLQIGIDVTVPSLVGEFRNDGTDVTVFSGSAVRNLSNIGVAAGGADVFLSNLSSPTSINQSLIPQAGKLLGSDSSPWSTTFSNKIRIKTAGTFTATENEIIADAVTGMEFNTPAGDLFSFFFNGGTASASISVSQMRMNSGDFRGTGLNLDDFAGDPIGNGEFRRNSTDVKVFSGGAVRNLSDLGTGTFLPLAGGTMSGAINMGDNDLTSVDDIFFNATDTEITNGAGIMSIRVGASDTLRLRRGTTSPIILDTSGIRFSNDNIGFYNTTPIAQQTGVAVTAAGIHAALVSLGLITA